MPKYYVTAERVIKYEAFIEADTLEDADHILEDMILDDFDEVTSHTDINPLIELGSDDHMQFPIVFGFTYDGKDYEAVMDILHPRTAEFLQFEPGDRDQMLLEVCEALGGLDDLDRLNAGASWAIFREKSNN